MPSITQPYEVLLDFTNDTHDPATVQLLRDFDRQAHATVLLRPGESLTLVLDAGMDYQYALKTRSKVVNVTCVFFRLISILYTRTSGHSHIIILLVSFSAKAWRDINCVVSELFPPGSPPWPSTRRRSPVTGITVDRLFRDLRFCMITDVDL